MEPNKEYSKHGYHFKLHKAERLKDYNNGFQKWKAIYVADRNIEVVILSETEPHPIFNPGGDRKLSLPSTEEWGVKGWTYSNIEQAVEKFNTL